MPASFPTTASSITSIEITTACTIKKQQNTPIIKTKPPLKRANTAPNLSTNNDPSKQLLFDKIKPELIAEQLTVLMYDIFVNIPFNNTIDYTNNNSNSDIKDYIKIFNQTVTWVQYSILSAPNSKNRAKTICKWIKICDILLKKNNFHGLIAVHCALRSNSVYSNKLKIAWTKHKSVFRKKYLNKFDTITDIVSYEDNYRLLRNKMSQSNNINCESSPVLPYWGLFKRDCSLINEYKNTQNAMNLLIKQYNEYRQYIGIYTKIEHDKLIQSYICHQLNHTNAITMKDMEIMSDNVKDFDKNIYGKKRYSLKKRK